MPTATCCECNRTRPLTDTTFWIPRRTGDGSAVQSRCRECNARQSARRTLTQHVATGLERRGATVTVRSAYRRLLVRDLPNGWLDRAVGSIPSRAEALAASGVAVVDQRTKLPMLPKDPAKALRTAYRLLVPIDPESGANEGRLGSLDDDKLYLLTKLDELASKPGIPKGLTKHVEDVKQVAAIHAGGHTADEAARKLFPSMRRRHYKFAAKTVALGLLSREESDARMNAGIMIGILKWSPLHKKHAALASVIGWWVLRELQLRTRADRDIGVYEIEPGVWSKAACSLSGLGGKCSDDEGGGSYVPNMKPVNGDTVVGGGRQRNGTYVAKPEDGPEALRADLTAAIRTLDVSDQKIILWVAEGKTIGQIGKELGMTTSETRRRLKNARAKLQSLLNTYA